MRYQLRYVRICTRSPGAAGLFAPTTTTVPHLGRPSDQGVITQRDGPVRYGASPVDRV